MVSYRVHLHHRLECQHDLETAPGTNTGLVMLHQLQQQPQVWPAASSMQTL